MFYYLTFSLFADFKLPLIYFELIRIGMIWFDLDICSYLSSLAAVSTELGLNEIGNVVRYMG